MSGFQHHINLCYICNTLLCVIPWFVREVDENCALLGYYAASSGNFLPTSRDNLSVPSSRFKNLRFVTLERR
jgi:hypothetical protein